MLIHLFIILLGFGVIGGAFRPIRIVIILCLPFTIKSLSGIQKKDINQHKFVFLFFMFWISYGILSLFWINDVIEGIKEVVYLLINFIGFFTVVIFAYRANNTHNTIIKGWRFLFLCTMPIAFCELFLNRHLYVNSYEDLYAYGGILRRYASVTFGNLNAYNLVIVYALPFVIATVFKELGKIKLISILLISLIILMNSSRGAFFCLILVLMIVLSMFFKNNNIVNKKFIWLLLLAPMVLAIKYYDLIIGQIIGRFREESSDGEGYRFRIVEESFHILEDYNFFGVGSGNFQVIMKEYLNDYNFFSPHNLFLEILVQYGVIISFLFIYLLYRMYKQMKKVFTSYQKFILLSFFITLPISSIINSSYILNSYFWVYLASIYIFSYNFKREDISSY